MGDIRFRVCAAAVLSFSAFFSISSAIAALFWWIIFTPRFSKVPDKKIIWGTAVLICAFSLVLQVLYGTGPSYGIRMGAIFLIAIWIWSEQQPGEYLSFCSWLFGNRRGFDLGLIAELGMQAFSQLFDDYSRIKTAWAIKGKYPGIQQVPAACLILTRNALMRAEDTTELLAVRGFRNGGTLCPSFPTRTKDIVESLAAVIIGSVMFLPVGEFFILP